MRPWLTAPKGRVIAVDLEKPQRENWREIIPQAKETLEDVGIVGNLFVCEYLKDATTQVRIFDTSGKSVRDIQMPGLGTAGGFGGKPFKKLRDILGDPLLVKDKQRMVPTERALQLEASVRIVLADAGYTCW